VRLIDSRYTLLDETIARFAGPRQVVTRNLDKLSVLTADKGYNWELLRHKSRSEGVKPVIKYREFGWNSVANNVLLDGTTYYKQSNVAATFCTLTQIRRDRARSNLVRTVPRIRP